MKRSVRITASPDTPLSGDAIDPDPDTVRQAARAHRAIAHLVHAWSSLPESRARLRVPSEPTEARPRKEIRLYRVLANQVGVTAHLESMPCRKQWKSPFPSLAISFAR
jgi:hypothetical protein